MLTVDLEDALTVNGSDVLAAEQTRQRKKRALQCQTHTNETPSHREPAKALTLHIDTCKAEITNRNRVIHPNENQLTYTLLADIYSLVSPRSISPETIDVQYGSDMDEDHIACLENNYAK